MAKASPKTSVRSPATGGKAPSARRKKSADGAVAAPGALPKGKKLVIVESPAKAKTINKYLGGDFVVKASMGHVRDLPAKGLGVDLEHDFAPSYEPLAGRRKVLAELKKLAKTAPEVFLATDMDREGEAIAWHLAEELGVPPERLRRVVFNEITKPAIQAAFAQPGQIDRHKVDAQQARRILDRIVGYQLSPLLWRKVAVGLSAGRVQSVAVRLVVDREHEIQVFLPEEFWKISGIFTADIAGADELARKWSALLAQTEPPTQARQNEFLAGQAAFRAELTEWKGQRFNATDEQAALEAARALGLAIGPNDIRREQDAQAKGPAVNRVSVAGRVDRGAGAVWKVAELTTRVSRQNPPGPFTTVTMQQAASVQLRCSASRTMRIAQQLYEGVELGGEGAVGLITYMRTDSLNLSPQAVGAVRDFIAAQFGGQYLPEKANFYRSGPRSQAAHEAIRPTDVSRTPESLEGALEEDQLRLYRLIWRRFVACQMSPAQWNVTDVTISGTTPAGLGLFKATGRSLAFDGFLKVAGPARADDQVLPPLATGQAVAPAVLLPSQHFTQPPPRYTEASLIKALEAEGIGRPSTYAAIIQTIQDRQYVRQEERKFFATDLGIKVTEKLVGHFPDIFDVSFTAGMEDKLDLVEEARADWIKVLHEFYTPFKAALEKATTEMVHAKAESQPSEYTCPACSKPMVYRWSKNGRYLACTGYPECKTTSPVDENGKRLERKQVDVPCPNCGKGMVLRRSRFGAFLGCSDYPTCKGITPCDAEGVPLKLVKDEDIKETCPNCGSPMQVRRRGRRAFLGCSRYPDCKTSAPIPPGLRLAGPPKAPPKEAGMNCPKCGKPMLIRTGRRGEFVACSGFPRCKNAFDLSKLEEMKKTPQK